MDADSSSSMTTDSDDEPTPNKNRQKLFTDVRITKEGTRISKPTSKSSTKNPKSSMATTKRIDSSHIGASSTMEIGESSVIYRIYALKSTSTTNGSINDENLATLRAMAFNLSKDYIWHKEPFRLNFKADPIPHLYGETDFGENSEDEWFIVYLLFEMSKNFPDFLISIIDSDGQFVLIEAADYVPSWLDNDGDGLTDNRVFIFRGALHIVPLWKQLKPCPRAFSESSSSIDRLLTEDPGRIFSILRDEHLLDQSRASENIQRTILKRIETYPTAINEQRHRFNCVLPSKLVALLNECGSIFYGPAVELACRKEEKPQSSSPHAIEFSSTDLLTTSIVLSRNLYAKLLSSSEIPNYVGSHWILPKKDALGAKANELGMKLTKGLERLANKGTTESQGSDGTWEKFVEMLHVLGYFEDAGEGTRAHDRLVKRAQLYHQACKSDSGGKDFTSSLGACLSTSLANLDVLNADVLRCEYPPQEEDDDEWMNLTPEKLELMLSNKWMTNTSTATKTTVNGSSRSGEPTSKNSSMNGDHGSKISVISKHAVMDSGLKNASSNAQQGPGNADPFTDSVKKMLDLHIPHDGDESSDMESYGDESLDLSMDEKGATAAINAFTSNMKDYMKTMEVGAKSGVGSATRPKPPRKHKRGGKSNEKGSLSVDKGALRDKSRSPGVDSIDDVDDDFTPVDIDKRMVSDILESYFPEACGQSGSTSTLLHGNQEQQQAKKKRTKKLGGD